MTKYDVPLIDDIGYLQQLSIELVHHSVILELYLDSYLLAKAKQKMAVN